MKILVTGGAGFIGSHLAAKLIEQGHDIKILDNFSTSKKENANKKAKVLKGDVRDAADVKAAMRDCECVFHLAAISDARSCDDDTMYQVNFVGSKNVFEAAKKAGAKVIFTSSAAVYGEAKNAREEDKCNPISQYGKSKIRAEKICQPDAFIARMFNVYGPGGKSIVNKLCKLVPKYEDMPVFGTGMQTRDFVYVDDVVSALMLGMENSGIYNVATGKETSVLELIDLVQSATNAKATIKFMQPDANDIKRSKADIRKITTLSWTPAVSLEEGIRLILKSTGFNFDLLKHTR